VVYTLKNLDLEFLNRKIKSIHNYIENMCIQNILLRKMKTELHDDEEEEEEDSRDLLHA
jgi:hypothetical protein